MTGTLTSGVGTEISPVGMMWNFGGACVYYKHMEYVGKGMIGLGYGVSGLMYHGGNGLYEALRNWDMNNVEAQRHFTELRSSTKLAAISAAQVVAGLGLRWLASRALSPSMTLSIESLGTSIRV